VLDGGLATELERRGFDLKDPLWSAKILVERPDAIRRVHLDYLEAGAECITTASYQATFDGLRARGFDRAAAERLLRDSVALAQEAREEFASGRPEEAERVRIAASIGPYGAYLADGSEFRGDYGLSRDALMEFHARRFEVLAGSGADVLACETIPCLIEAEALARLIERARGVWAWVSFSCRDGARTRLGEPIEEGAALLEQVEGVAAVGVNCTAPEHVEELIERIRSATRKPIVVYPNSGQTWDAAGRRWIGRADVASFLSAARQWRLAGATAIGGCCMTGPEHVRGLAKMAAGAADEGG
jgi:homocysteine S-methyltransferase